MAASIINYAKLQILSRKEKMSKQYLIVNGDQILLDIKLVFAAIREADGDWEQVEDDLDSILDNIQDLISAAEEQDEE